MHLLQASDGTFPSDLATGDPDAIEEERRLLYVAVTRYRGGGRTEVDRLLARLWS